MSEIIHKDKEGEKFKFRNITYFACRGMVMIVDGRTGEMKTESPITMRSRAVAFAQESESMRVDGGHYSSERRELLNAAKQLMQVIQDAEKQGCPLDPKVAREIAEQRRKVVVSMGGHAIPKSAPKGNRSPGGLILPG